MRCAHILSVIVAISIVFNTSALAFETDQFNLPPEPLADIGGEISQYVEDNLRSALDTTNAEIAFQRSCQRSVKRPGCGSEKEVAAQLAFLLSDEAIAKALFKRIGDGTLTTTKTGDWFSSHKFEASPSKYKTSFGDSIYVSLPFNYLTISPTINVFGVNIGLDKVEHLLQQGYKYHKIRNGKIVRGKSVADAERSAVRWGQLTERSYYGLYVSGVYSNGDLAANFAGMKFYQGLTEPLRLGETTRPAIVELKNDRWQMTDNVDLPEMLLKPFMSEHLNEALNPSLYAFTVYPTVKQMVREHACPEWRELMPDAKKADLEKRSASLETWFGEDYGFGRKGRSVQIASCFAD